MDPTYGNCATNVIAIVKTELKNSFGYDLSSKFSVQDTSVKGAPKTGAEFILFNGLRSPQLQDMLADSASVNNKAWMGFAFVILQIVNSSAAKTVDNLTLLSKVREIDDRFPESISKKSSSADVPVPELGADFSMLMKRMVTERYLTVKAKDKKDADTEDSVKVNYAFGARFYAEFGQKQAITSYYQTLGQRVDMGMLNDAVEAEQEMHDKIAEEEVEEEGADGSGAQIQQEGEKEEEEAPKKRRKKIKST